MKDTRITLEKAVSNIRQFGIAVEDVTLNIEVNLGLDDKSAKNEQRKTEQVEQRGNT